MHHLHPGCLSQLLGQILISQNQPVSHKSSGQSFVPPRVLHLSGPINQVFLTSSGPLLWHWTRLPSATGSWRASGRRGSFLCSHHHCQPAGQNRASMNVGRAVSSAHLTATGTASVKHTLSTTEIATFVKFLLVMSSSCLENVQSNISVICDTARAAVSLAAEHPPLSSHTFWWHLSNGNAALCSLWFLFLSSPRHG